MRTILFSTIALLSGLCAFAQSNPGLNNLTECSVYAPTAFTPNRDNTNDEFRVVISEYCDPVEFHLYVYDRYGRLVFESIDPLQGWDGRYDGKSLKEGVYMWHVLARYTIPSGDKSPAIDRKGSVVMLR